MLMRWSSGARDWPRVGQPGRARARMVAHRRSFCRARPGHRRQLTVRSSRTPELRCWALASPSTRSRRGPGGGRVDLHRHVTGGEQAVEVIAPGALLLDLLVVRPVRSPHPYGGVGGIQNVRYPGLAATIGAPPAAGGLAFTKGSAGGITVQAGQGFRPEPEGEEAHRGGQGPGQQAGERRKLKEFGQRFKKKR